MRKINYILLSLFSLLYFSCIKDALQSDFVEIDEIKVTGIEKRYDITLGDQISINPTITSKFGAKEEDFDYVWYKYNLSAGNKADTLGFEKNLTVTINDVTPGIPHYITFKITDKKTKLFTLVRADLTTTSLYSGGIVALVKTNNEIDLSFIKNGQNEVSNNLFSNANNGKKLSPTSFNLMSLDPNVNESETYRRILISTGDENIGVYLSPETFSILEQVQDKFFQPMPKGVNYKLKASFNSQGSEYLLIDDKLYDRMIDGDNPKFNGSILCPTEPLNHSVASFAFTPSGIYGAPIIFDNLNGRFMIHHSESQIYTFLPNNLDKTIFDPAKLPGLTMICGGYFSDDSSDNMWGLMKDANTGNFRILSMQCINKDWVGVYKLLGNKEITRDMAPKLFEATHIKSASTSYVSACYPWAYEMRGIKNMFLYILNNKLYVYNISSNYEGILVDGDAEGFIIDDVFVHRTFLTINQNGAPDYFERLALTIRDKNATGMKGGVAYYRVNVLGGISVDPPYFKKTGFCDQVLSLDEKVN